jgi:Ca2+-binding RTX toxin-like protein
MVDITTTDGDDTVRPAELGGSSGILPPSTDGTDWINASTGSDYIDGGPGYDILTYSGVVEPVRVNLREGYARKGGAGTDILAMASPGYSSVEQVHGTYSDDVVLGDDGDNWIWGFRGRDTIDGGAGSDTVGFHAAPGGMEFALFVNLTESPIELWASFEIMPGQALESFRDRALYVGYRGELSNVENLSGSNAPDWFFGNSTSNFFWGLQGDDILRGGGGVDTAIHLEPRTAYQVLPDRDFNQGYVVSGPEGDDRLYSVEKLRFADGDFWIEEAAGVTGIVHRFYDTQNGTHFFTASNAEANYVREQLPAFDHEGYAFRTADAAALTIDVFHFYNAIINSHFYTASIPERDYVQSALTQYELVGIGFQAYGFNDGTKAELHRFYDPQKQGHFFTASEAERDLVMADLPSYKYEGVAFYVDPL